MRHATTWLSKTTYRHPAGQDTMVIGISP